MLVHVFLLIYYNTTCKTILVLVLTILLERMLQSIRFVLVIFHIYIIFYLPMALKVWVTFIFADHIMACSYALSFWCLNMWMRARAAAARSPSASSCKSPLLFQASRLLYCFLAAMQVWCFTIGWARLDPYR
jgi:hypothetical protein